MKSLDFGRYALSGCLAAAMAACAGSQAPVGALSSQNLAAVAHFAHNGSWMASKATNVDLAYMALGNEVGIYSLSGAQVGLLKGLNGVTGLCSDPQGNVWVTYGDSLLEYARGGTVPIAQFFMPSGYNPYSCAVDATNGDIAVTDYSEEDGGNVAVYQNIYGTPQIYTDSDLSGYAYCSYDDRGNLFVNGTHGKMSLLAELPSGSNTLDTIKLDEKIGQLGGLQWDGQYLALGDSLAHVVYQLSVTKGRATTKSTTHFKGWYGHFKTVEPFAIADGVIVLTFSERQTGFWKFPAGGKSSHRIAVVGGAKTISVAPSTLRGDKR
jgi:hypothetical protein